MKFILPLHKDIHFASLTWHESLTLSGVRYGTRQVSLARRIDLTSKVRELCLRNDFLKAGDIADRLEASVADLLVRKVYLEWGLAEIEGLKIDGQPATPETLIEKGPESLADEIITTIQSEIGLTDDEAKNS